MGIKNLNKFLKENARSSINLMHISELSGKSIAVDASIYMHRFLAEDALIENMYLMLSIFKYYNIQSIFIFEGKPPPEKYELLQKRKQDRLTAEEEYNLLKQKLEDKNYSDEFDKHEIICTMDMLKKNMTTINKNDIEVVKNLITNYGSKYYDAVGEADELCALLTVKNKVWACLSEDMDMFVYGCTRVIRYLSLLNHTLVVYDMKGILTDLGISQKEFREICVLSGTDYNIDDDVSLNLTTTLKKFKKYFKSKSTLSFYEWLLENNTSYIKDYELLKSIYKMFDLENSSYSKNTLKKIKISSGVVCKEKIKEILLTDGFIFP